MKILLSALAGAALMASCLAANAEEAADRPIHLDIDAGTLTDALNEWAQQTGFNLISEAVEVTDRAVAPQVKGALTAKDALVRLLDGTPLTYQQVNARTITIHVRPEVNSPSPGSVQSTRSLAEPGPGTRLQTAALAALESPGRTERSGGTQGNPGPGSDQNIEPLFEVVVTGTYLDGELLAPGNLIVIDRLDIENSGYTTTSQLIAHLPQNFGGGASQTTGNLTRGNAGLNTALGSGVNLRGLGTGATLTLLNGNRLSPGGHGSFVDVSLIPLSAIERIDVLTDGASAIYGADAIGGVVNIITRRDYDGAETSGRVASVTSGDRSEYSLSQLLGHSWSSGNVTLHLEHTEQDGLRSADRPFAIAEDGPYHLLPSQRWNSLVSSLQLDFSPTVRLTSDLLATERNYTFKYFRSVDPPENTGDVTGVGFATGLEADVGDTWRVELIGNYSRNRQRSEFVDPLQPGNETSQRQVYRTWSGELRGTGELFSLPAGAAKLAIGAMYRDEGIDVELTPASLSGYADERSIRSAYAELSIPVFGSDAPDSARLLKLSVAGRVDDYSDVGRTSNPRFAVLWRVARGFLVRATYSESFRAPLFRETLADPLAYSAIAYDVPDPQSTRPDGLSTALVLDGPNTDLGPETARSWTAGLEFSPEWASAFKATLNYFDITYQDRIIAMQSVDAVGFLVNEPSFRDFIVRNPDDQLLTSILTPIVPQVHDLNTFQFGISDVSAFLAQNTFGALFDGRIQNAAESDLQGVDGSIDFERELTSGVLTLGLSASYLLDYSSRFTSSAPSLELLNTTFNPVDLRARGAASWTRAAWTLGASVNYVDGYEDPGGTYTQGGQVASWTTVDAQVRYESDAATGSFLDGLSVALSVLNLLDEEPPRLQAQPGQLAFDAENANPLGRFVTLSVTKRW